MRCKTFAWAKPAVLTARKLNLVCPLVSLGQAMSSKEIERSVKPFSLSHASAKRKPKRRPPKKAGAKQRTPDDFVEDFARKLSDAKRCHRGSLRCSFDCFEKVQNCMDGIVQWRAAFKDLPTAVAEKELLWIFRTARPSAKAPTAVKRKLHDVDGSG